VSGAVLSVAPLFGLGGDGRAGHGLRDDADTVDGARTHGLLDVAPRLAQVALGQREVAQAALVGAVGAVGVAEHELVGRGLDLQLEAREGEHRAAVSRDVELVQQQVTGVDLERLADGGRQVADGQERVAGDLRRGGLAVAAAVEQGGHGGHRISP
jgi:hypothetical protein